MMDHTKIPSSVLPIRYLVIQWRWLVGWLLNGTSTQKGQFFPTVGEGKANEIGDTMHITLSYTITMQHIGLHIPNII